MRIRTRFCACAVLLISLCLFPCQVLAFRIVDPHAGALLRSGQDVTVGVDLEDETDMVNMQYYWYAEDEEPVALHLAQPALVATHSSTPPYGGVLAVPVEALGPMRLLAVGEVAKGRLAGRVEFDEIIVHVKPATELIGIEFDVVKPWRLDTLGKLLQVPVVGRFADGVVRRIGGASSGSAYRSSNEQVVEVGSDGVVQVVGNGRATLTVASGGQQGVLEVVVKAEEEPNQPPTAHAGPDLTVGGGKRVVLNGLRSFDPDGDPLMYVWTQVRGHKVSLLDPGTAKATFMAPEVSSKRLLRFSLRVTDMKGADTVRGADSLPSLVNVWVVP
ncbi:MAG: hypothetical protein IH803_09500 [Nitrospirae bacterium]|nr:hypothetical protein [Nitrospirota bacterium]